MYIDDSNINDNINDSNKLILMQDKRINETVKLEIIMK